MGSIEDLLERQLSSERQCEGFEQQRDARALSCSRNRGRARGRAIRARAARDVGVDSGLELETVQLALMRRASVVNRLISSTARRAVEVACMGEAELEVDPTGDLINVEGSGWPGGHEMRCREAGALGRTPAGQTLAGSSGSPLTGRR